MPGYVEAKSLPTFSEKTGISQAMEPPFRVKNASTEADK